MLNKLKEYSYGDARYIVLKELDTRGPIGDFLLNFQPHYATLVMQMGEFIDTWDSQMDALPPSIMEIPGIQDQDFQTICAMHEMLPDFILLHSELDWNTFISAYLTFLSVFVNLTIDILHHYETPENTAEMQDLVSRIQHYVSSLDSTLRLCELGAGFSDLLHASQNIVRELQGWKQSNPSAVRLSQAYLKAIGFMPEDDN